MNGYYQYDDALTRLQKSAYALPNRSRATFRQESRGRAPVSAVWGVVSSLVQALSDARDELTTLLTSDGVRGTRKSDASTVARHSSRSPSRSPNRSPCRSPSRPFSAPSSDSRTSRSPIRTSGNCGRECGARIRSSNSLDRQKPHAITRTATYCSPPVSFGMNLQFDSVRRGKSPPVGCRRPAGRYQAMTLNQRGITPHGLEYFSAVPERRRDCSATRFADLIQAETYHLRERRLAEESVATLRSRPSWY